MMKMAVTPYWIEADNLNSTACIIFDCDGTLVDSETLGTQVLAKALLQHQIKVSATDLLRDYRGAKFAQMIKELEQHFGTRLPERFIPDYRLAADRVYAQHLQAMPGASELLSALDKPICVASNAPVLKTRRSLEYTGLHQFFGDALYSAYDIDAWKPDPTLFHHAAHDMGFDAEQCLVVEDSEAGMQAGLAAGMRTVLLDPHQVHRAPPQVQCIRELPELLQLL
ncbi:MAG: HAD-IA family hydrolase [Granulosicoccaceae bacterium]